MTTHTGCPRQEKVISLMIAETITITKSEINLHGTTQISYIIYTNIYGHLHTDTYTYSHLHTNTHIYIYSCIYINPFKN